MKLETFFIHYNNKKQVFRDNITSSLCFIFVFLVLFDPMKGYCILGPKIRYYKDFFVLLMFITLFINYKELRNSISLDIWLILVCIILISFVALFNGMQLLPSYYKESILLFFKVVEMCVVFLFFINLNSKELHRILYIIIILSSLILFFNIIGCYLPNSFFYKEITTTINEGFPPYEKRLSVGQPTLVVLPCIIAICSILISEKISRIQAFSLFINLTTILLSTAVTSYITIFLISIITVIIYLFFNKIQNLKLCIIVTLCSILLVLFLWSSFLIDDSPIDLLRIKIGSIVDSDIEDPSMEMRYNRVDEILINDDTTKKTSNYLFGKGYLSFCKEGDIFPIENTFFRLFYENGIVGLALYLFILFKISIKGFKMIKNRKLDGFVLILLTIVYICYSYTLDIFSISSTSLMFAMITGIYIKILKE